MMDSLLRLIRKKYGIDKSIEETNGTIEKIHKLTVDGEERWMLTRKKNGSAKSFDCSCIEKEAL